MSQATTNIYVLKLKNNKYYVGQSTNVNQRIKQHERGEGSAWTQKYEPVEVVEIKKNASPFDEDKMTKQYMAKYGVENVRGGSYSQVRLTDEQEDILQREIDTATGACFRCGEKGHFANQCDAESCSEDESEEEDSEEEDYESVDEDTCYRCGRSGHWASECYAKSILGVPKQSFEKPKVNKSSLMGTYKEPSKKFVFRGRSLLGNNY